LAQGRWSWILEGRSAANGRRGQTMKSETDGQAQFDVTVTIMIQKLTPAANTNVGLSAGLNTYVVKSTRLNETPTRNPRWMSKSVS